MAGHAPRTSPHRFRRASAQPGRGEAACTAFAIWCGPETYEESITVDNTSDGKTHAAAVLQQA